MYLLFFWSRKFIGLLGENKLNLFPRKSKLEINFCMREMTFEKRNGDKSSQSSFSADTVRKWK